MKKMNIRLTCEKGVSAIEFALVLPLLMTFLLGIVEYGWFFKTKIALDNALACATRAVVKESGYESPKDIAVSAMVQALDGEVDAATLEPYLCIDQLSDPDRAKLELANFPYQSLTGYFPAGMIPSRVSSTSVAVYP